MLIPISTVIRRSIEERFAEVIRKNAVDLMVHRVPDAPTTTPAFSVTEKEINEGVEWALKSRVESIFDTQDKSLLLYVWNARGDAFLADMKVLTDLGWKPNFPNSIHEMRAGFRDNLMLVHHLTNKYIVVVTMKFLAGKNTRGWKDLHEVVTQLRR